MTSDQKKAAKAERDRLEEPFAFAVVDGRREKLGNFRVEPPGLFRGRGEHPKMGQLKSRIFPEDITINLSEDAQVPQRLPDILLALALARTLIPALALTPIPALALSLALTLSRCRRCLTSATASGTSGATSCTRTRSRGCSA